MNSQSDQDTTPAADSVLELMRSRWEAVEEILFGPSDPPTLPERFVIKIALSLASVVCAIVIIPIAVIAGFALGITRAIEFAKDLYDNA